MSRDKHTLRSRGESSGTFEFEATNLRVRVGVRMRWMVIGSLVALASIIAAVMR